MAKYRPIDYFEPAMTALIYTAGFSAISFGNVPTACVFLTLSPFCLMFGMFPQSLCLLYWVPDIICKFLQLPLIGFESIMVATTTSICYILAPVECLIIYFFTCLACASFRKNYRVKLAFLIMLSIINIVAGAVLYYY